MKYYKFIFKNLTEKQERCLEQGFIYYYNESKRKFNTAIKHPTVRLISDAFQSSINFSKISPDVFELGLNAEMLNAATHLGPGPLDLRLGDKIYADVLKFFYAEIVPKMGIKKDDVDITIENTYEH